MADALRANDTALFSKLAHAQPKFETLVNCALQYAVAGQTSLAEVMALSGHEEELWEKQDQESLEHALRKAQLVAAEPTPGAGSEARH